MAREMRRFLFIAVLASGCFAPERLPVTGRVERTELRASAVDETYALFVRLPPQYETEPERRFPLIVQLDANLPMFEEFEVMAGQLSKLEREGRAEPSVVVGVGYATGNQAQVARFRDYGLPITNTDFAARWDGWVPRGDCERFHAFLRDELAPHLDTTLRLNGARALSGHSMGGLFTLYALSQEPEAPLFTGFLAASPSLFWDDGQLLTRWKEVKDPSRRRLLFMSAGKLEGPEMNGFFDELGERLDASGFQRLEYEVAPLPNVDHVGAVAPAFRQGVEFLFAHGFGSTP